MSHSKSLPISLLGVVALLGALAASPAAAQARTGSCDRRCLAEMLENYLKAVAGHSPTAAPLAANYRATENGTLVSADGGMWTSFSGPGAVQRRYYDPVTSQALYYGTITTGGQDAVASIRIKVLKGKIADAEWIFSQAGQTMVSIPGLIADPPRPDGPIAAGRRSTREQLIAAAESYFEGLERHDSAGVLKIKGCPRVENGTRVTGMRKPPAEANGPAVEFDAGDCGDNLDRMVQIDRVVARRYPVVDTEAGVVAGYVLFLRQPGVKRPDGTEWPRLLLSEIFTEEKGRISGIYAAMRYLPADAPSATGW